MGDIGPRRAVYEVLPVQQSAPVPAAERPPAPSGRLARVARLLKR